MIFWNVFLVGNKSITFIFSGRMWVLCNAIFYVNIIEYTFRLYGNWMWIILCSVKLDSLKVAQSRLRWRLEFFLFIIFTVLFPFSKTSTQIIFLCHFIHILCIVQYIFFVCFIHHDNLMMLSWQLSFIRNFVEFHT